MSAAGSMNSTELLPPPAQPVPLLADGHIYFVGQESYPGVSEILQGAGMVDLSGIPEDRLEYARVRGSAVHLACHYYDLGVLNWDSVDPAIVGYLRSYIAFKQRAEDAIGFQVLGSEIPLTSKQWRFCGTLDKIAKVNGGAAVIDLKTPITSRPATRFQTAGYHLLVNENFPALKTRKRFELKLFKDEKIGELIPFNDLEEDVQGFLWAASLHHLKLKHGIIGGK